MLATCDDDTQVVGQVGRGRAAYRTDANRLKVQR